VILYTQWSVHDRQVQCVTWLSFQQKLIIHKVQLRPEIPGFTEREKHRITVISLFVGHTSSYFLWCSFLRRFTRKASERKHTKSHQKELSLIYDVSKISIHSKRSQTSIWSLISVVFVFFFIFYSSDRSCFIAPGKEAWENQRFLLAADTSVGESILNAHISCSTSPFSLQIESFWRQFLGLQHVVCDVNSIVFTDVECGVLWFLCFHVLEQNVVFTIFVQRFRMPHMPHPTKHSVYFHPLTYRLLIKIADFPILQSVWNTKKCRMNKDGEWNLRRRKTISSQPLCGSNKKWPIWIWHFKLEIRFPCCWAFEAMIFLIFRKNFKVSRNFAKVWPRGARSVTW